MNCIIPGISNIVGCDSIAHKDKVESFESLLLSTNREGIDSVINVLRSSDFYASPASSIYHSNYDGGLLDHSLCVLSIAMNYKDIIVASNPEIKDKLLDESVIISSLLHDVCKCCMYVKGERRVYDKSKPYGQQWYDVDGYSVQDRFPIGHGEKSVIMLQNFGLRMSVDEMLAIRYHMGMWGEFLSSGQKGSYMSAVDMSPLVSLIQIADYSSSQLIEKTIKTIK